MLYPPVQLKNKRSFEIVLKKFVDYQKQLRNSLDFKLNNMCNLSHFDPRPAVTKCISNNIRYYFILLGTLQLQWYEGVLCFPASRKQF